MTFRIYGTPVAGTQSVPAAPRRRAMVPGPIGGMGGAYAYDAANMFGQETADWQPPLRSPDSSVNYDRDRMVARSNDLYRNDGWAKGGLTRILDNVIGAQFRLSAKPDYRALQLYNSAFDATWAAEFSSAAEAEWRMWADDPMHHCDARRRRTITQMFRLALAHKLKDGDALGMLMWAPERVGGGAARYSTVLQLIHPDRLSNPQMQPDTRELRGGVEIEPDLGAPVAYHMRQAHQYDQFNAVESMIWDRFPRETPWGRPVVIHSYDEDDEGQHHGLGVFTPVLSRFKMLHRRDQAELQQALLQTIFATFITSPYDSDDVEKAMAEDGGDEISKYQAMRQDFHAANPLTLGGVRLPVLAPGEEPKTISATHPTTNFDSFQHAFLRNFAAAIGVSAEQLSQDYSKTNYSSARAAMLEAWKTMERRRTDFAIQFANPVYVGWLEEAFAAGRLPLPRSGFPDFTEFRAAYARCRWIGPARGWVDPVAERSGAVLGLDAAFGTLEQETAEQGMDWTENLDQRALEVAAMKQRGLALPQWAAGAPAHLVQQPPPKPDAT